MCPYKCGETARLLAFPKGSVRLPPVLGTRSLGLPTLAVYLLDSILEHYSYTVWPVRSKPTWFSLAYGQWMCAVRRAPGFSSFVQEFQGRACLSLQWHSIPELRVAFITCSLSQGSAPPEFVGQKQKAPGLLAPPVALDHGGRLVPLESGAVLRRSRKVLRATRVTSQGMMRLVRLLPLYK